MLIGYEHGFDIKMLSQTSLHNLCHYSATVTENQPSLLSLEMTWNHHC